MKNQGSKRLFWHPVQPEMRLRLHLRLVLVVLVWEWSGRIVAVPRRRRGWEIVSRGDDELHESKLEVLQAIPETPSGAPSTNSSMWPQQVRRLRAAVARLEVIARRRSAELWEDGDAMRQLNGSWRLIYSTSSDVAMLGELPLGFQLGRVYQPINVETHAFENQLMVDHTLRLAAGSLRVVGELVALPPGKKAHTPPNPTPPNPYM